MLVASEDVRESKHFPFLHFSVFPFFDFTLAFQNGNRPLSEPVFLFSLIVRPHEFRLGTGASDVIYN